MKEKKDMSGEGFAAKSSMSSLLVILYARYHETSIYPQHHYNCILKLALIQLSDKQI